MWTILNRPLDDKLVEGLRKHFSTLEGVFQDRHFVEAGKKYFKKNSGLDLLYSVMQHIQKELPLDVKWKQPAIQHTFPLYKSAGGPATTLHQDRAYWQQVEDEPTMMTFWIALDDIDAKMGCLRLNKSDQVAPSELKSLNLPSELHPHQPEGNRHIHPEVAARLAEKMEPIPVKKGQIILFDSFQVHGSEPNSTDRTRRAMKIALGNEKAMKKYLITLKGLDKHKPSFFNALRNWLS